MTELKASGKLPTPAGVALTILDLTRNPDSSTEDITSVMKGDPALSGQVLKYANSAASGVREEVTTVNQALVHLGMKVIQQLCLGISVLSNARTGLCPNFDYPRYWARSLARGVAAQILSKTIPAASPEEGFTYGLLSGIGTLGLANVYPREYSEILSSRQSGSRQELTDLEMRELSINRHQVTCALFEDWGLPENFQKAALLQDLEEWQPLPDDCSTLPQEKYLARLLVVAELIADIFLATGPEQEQLALRFLEIGDSLDIPENSWGETFDLIKTEWNLLGQGMDILTEHIPSLKSLKRGAEKSEKLGELGKTAQQPDETESSPKPDQISGREMGDKQIGETSLAAENLLAATEAGMHILLVSDNRVEQRILNKMLSSAGHTLTLAQDGHKALEMALQDSPELIIANWTLPSINGLELARMIRKSKQTSGTYFIIITSHDGQDQLVEAFEAGIDDYLLKPLNHAVVNARLKAGKRIIELQKKSAQDREELRHNVTTLGKLSRQVERMALEDQLTALPNRRAGLDRFEQEWSRSNRNKSSLLCMLLDIDHFKNVNDTHGHDCGDIVLMETARVMKAALRDSDVICRFGGEEFLVICPEADLSMAMKIGDRIRQAVQDNEIQCPGIDLSITISIGVALRNGNQESPKDLIKEADLALYAAKDSGRNMVCIYSD
ncbi:MAG: diguanylate cyclase [Gemmatimonadales bacterium]|nr:diguanylate cyclase [Gemmatimonadales bacterium]